MPGFMADFEADLARPHGVAAAGSVLPGMLLPGAYLNSVPTAPCDGRIVNPSSYPGLAKVLPFQPGPRSGGGNAFGGATASGLAYGNGVFVATQISTTDGTYFTSVDGRTWAQRQLPNTGAGENQVRFINGLFIMGITNTYPFVSGDGISWAQPVSSANNSSTIVQAGGIVYCSSASFGLVCTSNPSASWSSFTGISGTMYGGAFGNGVYVIATTSGVYVSADGKTFSTATTSVAAQNVSYGTQRLAFGNGIFILLTASGTYRSSDGTNWVLLQSSNIFTCVLFSNGTFFFSMWANSGNTIWSSSDGSIYQSVQSGTGFYRCYELATDGKQIVSAGVGVDVGTVVQALPTLTGYNCVMG